MYFSQASRAATCSFAAANATAAARSSGPSWAASRSSLEWWRASKAAFSRSIARACTSPPLTGRRGNAIASRAVFSRRRAAITRRMRVSPTSWRSSSRRRAARRAAWLLVMVLSTFRALYGSRASGRGNETPRANQQPAPRVSIIFPKLRASARSRFGGVGLRAEVLPAGPARYQVTPRTTRPFR
jgi:hypothetical protein